LSKGNECFVHLAGSGAGFFFGLATAPAHVEDQLDDAWLEFAEESKPEKEVVEYGTSDKTEEYGPGGSNVEGEGEKRSKSLSSSDGAQATLAEESDKKLNGETAGKTAGRMALDLQACICLYRLHRQRMAFVVRAITRNAFISDWNDIGN
jgi:hypothetical protein